MSRVRGPNSALTEFLRSQGINANEIRRRHEIRQQNREQEQEQEQEREQEQVREQEQYDNNEGSTILTTSSNQSEDLVSDAEIASIAEAAARKRRDDYNADHDGTSVCANCNSRFTITVYSKPAPNTEDQFLCRACSSTYKTKTKRSADRGASNKKRKKVAADLLDLRFFTPPSLQDMCITLAAEYIDSITELGGLTVTAFNKISRILSKNRRLSPKTMQLFLQPNVTQLEFWDCSTITPESFNLIPTLCPNLEQLTLGMCGQLCGDNLRRIAELPNLVSIHLDGPFMVRKDAWLDFFEVAGPKLKSLSIASVYRVDSEVMAIMVETCTNLESLSLRSLCQLRDPTPLHLLSSLTNLQRIEISDLEPEAWSDDALVQILNMVGSQLMSLVVKNAGAMISDRVVEAIGETCGKLTQLELVNLTEISDEAITAMFNHWTEVNSNTGLQTLSLERCANVGNSAVSSAIEHSGLTLVELSINSLRHTKPETIEKLAGLPNLTKLDIGFVGQVNPRQIYKLSTSKSLKHVLAFGNIRISGMPLPTGMTLLGTM